MIRGQKRGRGLGAIEAEILHDLTLGDMLYGFLLSGRSRKMQFKLAQERATHRFRRKCAIEHLSQKGYIREHSGEFLITTIGRNALGEMADKNRTSLQTKNWDKKWRIVVYDIPDDYAALRTQVRKVLKRAGFTKLQQSMWVFPHECEELVQLIREESKLSDYMLYGVLERIENEMRLKETFGLK
jgi:DNA-binding transcriptional regulator PaaX